MMADNRPIGVFDSGIGGLTVVDALANALPNESFLYVGDTARVPYGNKSQERVQHFSKEIADWLIAQDCKMIVVACNTASSLALPFLKSQYSVPILGVIHPGALAAIEHSSNYQIGVLGTNATISSNAYGEKINELSPDATVISQACPLFVPLVEEGWVDGDVPLSIAKAYLQPILDSKVDTVILGCTHYPILRSIIQDILGPSVILVDSGSTTSQGVTSILNKNSIKGDVSERSLKCFVTDSPHSFETLASKFLSVRLNAISHIELA